MSDIRLRTESNTTPGTGSVVPRRALLVTIGATAALTVLLGWGVHFVLPGTRPAAVLLVSALAAGAAVTLVFRRYLSELLPAHAPAAPISVSTDGAAQERHHPLGLWSGQARAVRSAEERAQDSTWQTQSGRIVLKRFRQEDDSAETLASLNDEGLAEALKHKRGELEQRLRERALLFDILRTTASEVELETVVSSLAQRLSTDLRLRECAILLRETSSDGRARFVVRAAQGFRNPKAVIGRAVREGEGVCGEVAKIRHPILVPDVNAEPHYMAFWAQAPRSGSFAAFPVIHHHQLIAVMALTRPVEDTLSEVEVRFLSAIADQMALAISHAELFERLRVESTQDELTGLANRRLFQSRLQLELERVSRFAQPLSVIMIDIDHFKRLNDTCGHAVGDDALKSVARVIQRSVRRIDTVARFGGEEFVVVLPNATVLQAARVAEKIRGAVAESVVPGAAHQPEGCVTVSVGVAQLSRGLTPEALLQRSDEAMYKAKQSGRNRVAYFPAYGGTAAELFEPTRSNATTERPVQLHSGVSRLPGLSDLTEEQNSEIA